MMFSILCLVGAAGYVCYPMLEQSALCFAAVPAPFRCLQLCLPLFCNLLLNLGTASKLCAAVRMQTGLQPFRIDLRGVCIAQWPLMASSARGLPSFQC
jgi:hypothetical protein